MAPVLLLALGLDPSVHLLAAFLDVGKGHNIVPQYHRTCSVSADLHRLLFRQPDLFNHVANRRAAEVMKQQVRISRIRNSLVPRFVERLDRRTRLAAASTMRSSELDQS